MKHLLPLVLLASLAGCGGRYVTVPCLTQEQLAERERAEPPKVGETLTGDAEKDIRPIAGSAIRLRAWGKGNLELLRGCTG